MNKLRLSPDLALPEDAVTQTFAILAKRGAGKTYTGLVLVEELLGAGAQVVVVDPVGVCWGLRAAANGKDPGLPIVVMGGDHGDVPLEATAGKVVAEFVVDTRSSVVLDLALLRKGDQVRFMTDFAETLYHRNRAPLHLLLDEADAFAPQRDTRNAVATRIPRIRHPGESRRGDAEEIGPRPRRVGDGAAGVKDTGGRMTKGERDELSKILKARARLAGRVVEQRSAELLAEAEQQLATVYKVNDEAWRELTATAQQTIREADAELARRCRTLGIPEEFRPGLRLGWYGRGENADKARRAELRKVAQSRIEAMAKAARVAIETRALDGLTKLAAGVLESDAARAFLAAMPAAEALMPALDVTTLGPLALSAKRAESLIAD
jgi:hypothetical protein